MITKKKIEDGIREGLVTFEVDLNMECGTVCRIGDWWFYFGGLSAEEMKPSEYIACTPQEDIVREIFDALDEFRNDEELRDEYDYYDHVLTYRNGL